MLEKKLDHINEGGAVQGRARSKMPEAELPPARTVEKARCALDQKGAALLIIGSARGAEREDPERGRDCPRPGQRGPCDLVELRSLDIAHSNPSLSGNEDDSIAGR